MPGSGEENDSQFTRSSALSNRSGFAFSPSSINNHSCPCNRPMRSWKYDSRSVLKWCITGLVNIYLTDNNAIMYLFILLLFNNIII